MNGQNLPALGQNFQSIAGKIPFISVNTKP